MLTKTATRGTINVMMKRENCTPIRAITPLVIPAVSDILIGLNWLDYSHSHMNMKGFLQKQAKPIN
jgi:hypothetical protein